MLRLFFGNAMTSRMLCSPQTNITSLDIGQTAPRDFLLQECAINFRHQQHAVNVAQVFFSATFPEKFKLPDNDVLRRRNPNRRTLELNLAAPLKRPEVSGSSPAK
jgi:hypothetical protein